MIVLRSDWGDYKPGDRWGRVIRAYFAGHVTTRELAAEQRFLLHRAGWYAINTRAGGAA